MILPLAEKQGRPARMVKAENAFIQSQMLMAVISAGYSGGMAASPHSLRGPCLAAAAAWLLFATVFLAAGRVASPVAEASRPDSRGIHSALGIALPTDHVEVDRLRVHGGSTADGEVGQAKRVWSLDGFVNDLRRPRPPRHRSERPTTGVDGIAAMMTSSTLRLMLSIDVYRPFLFDGDVAGPLAGHYRSLLRPPSVLS